MAQDILRDGRNSVSTMIKINEIVGDHFNKLMAHLETMVPAMKFDGETRQGILQMLEGSIQDRVEHEGRNAAHYD